MNRYSKLVKLVQTDSKQLGLIKFGNNIDFMRRGKQTDTCQCGIPFCSVAGHMRFSLTKKTTLDENCYTCRRNIGLQSSTFKRFQPERCLGVD